METNSGVNVSNLAFTQVFGSINDHEKLIEEDIISVLKFDKGSKHLYVGDKAGRIIVFERLHKAKNKELEFDYLFEFQSHTSEFDPLRSVEIE